MRTLALLLFLVAAAYVAAQLLDVVAGVPDGSAPSPRVAPTEVRRVRQTTPPASVLARWQRRLSVCRRQGHTWRLAFAHGYPCQRCIDCGAHQATDLTARMRVVRG